MPDLRTHPMQDAVAGLMQAFDGLHGTLGSIDVNRPAKDASYDAQVAFLDALRPWSRRRSSPGAGLRPPRILPARLRR